jgi:hypothetical protein
MGSVWNTVNGQVQNSRALLTMDSATLEAHPNSRDAVEMRQFQHRPSFAVEIAWINSCSGYRPGRL